MKDRHLNEMQTLALIEQCISDPPEGSRVLTITPAIAEKLLRERPRPNNGRNLESKIAEYAQNMEDGEWVVTGETIAFSGSGWIGNGHHRLRACVRSGTCFVTHVVFGIDDDAFDRTDSGAPRTAMHLLTQAGFKNTSALAAAIRWAHRIDTGRELQRDSIKGNMVVRLARETYCPEIEGFLSAAREINKVMPLATIPTVTALLYHFHRVCPVKAAAFAQAWGSGAWGGKYKIFEKLSKRLREMDEASMGRVNDVARAAMIVNVWNTHIDGRVGTTNDIDWSKGQAFPKIRS